MLTGISKETQMLFTCYTLFGKMGSLEGEYLRKYPTDAGFSQSQSRRDSAQKNNHHKKKKSLNIAIKKEENNNKIGFL